MRVNIKLAIVSDESPRASAFGQGMVMLLENIEQSGSIKKATKAMGMAYSKAWKMLTATEKGFGVKLLERSGHRGSSLTSEARLLLDLYHKIETEAQKSVDHTLARLQKQHFPET